MNKEIYEAVREIVEKITCKRFGIKTTRDVSALAKSIAEAVPEKKHIADIDENNCPDYSNEERCDIAWNAFYDQLLKNLKGKKK